MSPLLAMLLRERDAVLARALSELSQSERDVLKQRYFFLETQYSIALKNGTTYGCVDAIERRALKKIRLRSDSDMLRPLPITWRE